MGVFDNELILPGSITEITSDFSYGYETDAFGTTDSVTIIGTAFNGPTGKPMKIYSPEHAAYVFGEAYDYKTRREATLVAEIKDAWDRGCRTIYAIRVSGKEIYKDFALIPETKLKLRVSGLFPSNKNKDIYMVYDNTVGAEKIKVYKPASRATIQEKREGLVDTNDSVLVATIDVANGLGLTRDSRLVELITSFNGYYRNNVLKLSIVDENGVDVTIGSKEAQALSVGALFPGAYFIGRASSACVAVTNVEYTLTTEEVRPYESFEGAVFKSLKINTDVSSEYPIYGASVKALNEKFQGKIQMSKMFDFLEVYQKADVIFIKDKVDYEEVDIDDFDLYSRLGSGFATTAKAVTVQDDYGKVKIKKVIEAPISDPNRVQPITDGVYSMLEGLRSDYRVLAGVAADAKIEGRLPRKADFEIRLPLASSIEDLITATAIVDKKDKLDVRKFKFELKQVETEEMVKASDVKAKLCTKTIKTASLFADETAVAAAKLPEGALVLIGASDAAITKAGRITGGKFVAFTAKTNTEVEDMLLFCGNTIYSMSISGSEITIEKAAKAKIGQTDLTANEFVLVEDAGSVFVYKISEELLLEQLVPVGPVELVLDEAEDKTLITVQSAYNQENVITVQSNEFDYITLEELVDLLNEDKNLNKLFAFEIDQTAIAEKDTVVEDAFVLPVTTEATEDKEDGIDTNLYIPYKTNDTFVRHLAQHCKYTSLKTAPTHGIMGCGKVLDVNYTAIAKKVDSLLATDLSLYAKKDNGKDILDANNMPYPIGHLVSVVFGQYAVATLDGYTYVSNGAAGYAGMVSCLAVDQSSTNQPIALSSLMFELTNYQLEKLTQKGLVTFKQSYTKGIVVTDGVTLGNAASPFRRLSTARIINTVEDLIREATEPFIGKQNHLANRNSMQTAIKSNLDTIKDRLIKVYEFRLVENTDSEQMGIIDIEYRMVPVYEIREIRNQITVTDSL